MVNCQLGRDGKKTADEPLPNRTHSYIQGPDERGCVWMHGTSSRDPWSQNLGPRGIRSQWLGSIDYDETETPEAHAIEDDDAPPTVKLMTGLTGED